MKIDVRKGMIWLTGSVKQQTIIQNMKVHLEHTLSAVIAIDESDDDGICLSFCYNDNIYTVAEIRAVYADFKKELTNSATETSEPILSRLETFIRDVRSNLDDSDSDYELSVVLGNGDISTPYWVSIAESDDHLKVWDNEDLSSSANSGFIWVGYKDNE